MKNLFKTLLVAGALVLPVAAQAAQPAAPAAAQTKRAAGVWIDVRTPEEFKEGHLQDAVNIPVDQITANIARVAPNKKCAREPVLPLRPPRRSCVAGIAQNGLHQCDQPRRLSRFA